jgi:hypothetical protein
MLSNISMLLNKLNKRKYKVNICK